MGGDAVRFRGFVGRDHAGNCAAVVLLAAGAARCQALGNVSKPAQIQVR